MHNLQAHDVEYPRIEALVSRLAWSRADAVIVHSAYAAARVRERFGDRDGVHVIPHGNFTDFYPPPAHDRESVRARLGIPAGAFVYLAFGQVRPYKQLEATLRTFRTVADPGARLLVAGRVASGGLRAALERAAAADPRVVLDLRRIPDAEVAELHAASDAAVFGYREIFSSGALLLALSLGLPAVAPASGSTDEIAGAPALATFTPGPGALAAAMTAIRGHDPAAARAAALAAAQRLDWAPLAARTAEVFGEARAHAAGGTRA
jgi:glycosyltransferase involved in cell wall biosynthesis